MSVIDRLTRQWKNSDNLTFTASGRNDVFDLLTGETAPLEDTRKMFKRFYNENKKFDFFVDDVKLFDDVGIQESSSGSFGRFNIPDDINTKINDETIEKAEVDLSNFKGENLWKVIRASGGSLTVKEDIDVSPQPIEKTNKMSSKSLIIGVGLLVGAYSIYRGLK